MGCDIHMHVEVKIDNQWHYYGELHIRRHYALFDRLSHVRGYNYEGIAKNRGIPTDASAVTRVHFNSWGQDAHSEGYLTSEEIKDFIPIWNSQTRRYDHPQNLPFFYAEDLRYFFGNGYDNWYSEKENIPEEIQDFRFIFWYDN